MQAGAETNALILASRQGDREAFTRIIENYQRSVYAVAFSGVRDRALADDVTQDTFVTAWRQLGELRDASRLGAWLCGIARNLARDTRKRRHREAPDDHVAEPVNMTTPFDALSEAETERIVAAALGQVPDVYREPLVLYYYEERSVDDVARSLGISAATTNKRLSRGRRYLAHCVAIVERGLVQRGPSPGLAASVLAVLAVTAGDSHVDASPLVKGSTVNKFAIAAIVTASLGGAGVLLATASRSDANAKPSIAADRVAVNDTVHNTATASSGDFAATHMAHVAKGVPPTPSLAGLIAGGNGTAAASGGAADDKTDCATVGRHLVELEADTRGPSAPPVEAPCDSCTAIASKCESEGWSAERRTCIMAAADLINAHLCIGGKATAPAAEKPTNVPASLSCAVLGASVAKIAQSAGMHPDVKDLPQQIEAACDQGNWSVELRKCFAAAGGVDALQQCMAPDRH